MSRWTHEHSKEELIAELQKTNAFLDAIIENIPDMIFVKDAAELRFVRFNKAGEELLGYAREDLYGKNDYDFFPAGEADAFTRKDREVLVNGTLHDIAEEPILTHYKGERWLHTKKVPVLGPGGSAEFLLGISEDITEKKRSEEEKARLIDDLARSNQELEQFAYAASHDLREPLRTMASFSQLLASDYEGQLDDRADEWIAFIVDACARMDDLIRALLDLSRVGIDAKAFESTDLGAVLATVVADLGATLSEAEAEVVFGDLPTVRCDGAQIAQVFRNLIGNAIKFRSDRSPRVEVAVLRDEQRWLVSVRDNGIGFEQRFAGRVFEAFQRLHGVGEYPGVGMGLAIAKKIVERHGGRIGVESKPGVGTTVFFDLPA